MKKKRLAKLNPEESNAWDVYFSWYVNNHKDTRPSRADKYAWSMLCNEFPRLKKYTGALP